MNFYRSFAFATVSLLALSAPAFAGDMSVTNSAQTGASDAQSGDIVVSARRKDERLQDVPKVVTAVSGDELNKLNIRQFQDVQAVAPGLTLQAADTGYTQKSRMRGVSFDVNAGADATVDFYLDDASIQQGYVFRSMYDISDIEVLRGPQGTLRGRTTPSGSITVTTKAPDLYHYGAYVDGTLTGTSDSANDLQGAVNIPIIQGKLAVRVAAQFDDNNGNNVLPAHIAGQDALTTQPYNRTWSERISVRYEPTDTLQFNVMYQHMTEHFLQYLQTASDCVLAGTTCGPADGTIITPSQRLSTVNGSNTFAENFDIINGRADWEVLGQKLSYVGSYAVGTLTATTPMDQGSVYDAVIGYPVASGIVQTSWSRNQYQSHEVRLASQERILGMFDYTLGIFNATTPTQNLITYAGTTIVPNVGERRETSLFGNVTAHPIENLEISGGLRKIIASANSSTTDGFFTTQSPRWHPTIWSASASYHFTPTIMAYASAGTSSRNGTTSVGPVLTGLQYGVYPQVVPASVTQFANLASEYSHSYEVGVKTQFDGKKGLFNVSYFHQSFTNFQYANAGPIDIYGLTGSLPFYQVTGMGASVPVKVDGVEAEVAYKFSRNFNLGADLSYVHSKIAGGQVACNNGTPAGGAALSTCTASGPATYAPEFTATIHGEYSHSLGDDMTGYVRALDSIYGATPLNTDVPWNKQKSYQLLNAYVGVRAPGGQWDLSLFVKNLTNTGTLLASSSGNTQVLSALTGTGQNYAYVGYTPPRQVGVNLRVAFGSR